MIVPWDGMREEHIRTVARADATKIVTGALTGLHEKINGMYGVEADPLRAGLLYGIMGAVQDTIREIQTLGYDTDVPGPSAAVSRPVGDPVDEIPAECMNRQCDRAHGPSGRHA
jgi:hypothetical protein